jgi:hypothetical protein
MVYKIIKGFSKVHKPTCPPHLEIDWPGQKTTDLGTFNPRIHDPWGLRGETIGKTIFTSVYIGEIF